MLTESKVAWWVEAAPDLFEAAESELLSADTEAVTLLLTRANGSRSVFKAARRAQEKVAALRVQWEALTLLSEHPDFPGPRPLAYYDAQEDLRGIEISYHPGRHPEFGQDEDFRLFGATIARLHAVSRGKRLAAAPLWDLARITRHFAHPSLLTLMTPEQSKIATIAIERFGPLLQSHFDTGLWTGLIHSDSHRHNVVLHEGRGSLLDFGECGQGVLFWDLGVAVADSVVDAPAHATSSRRALLDGYLSVLPEAEPVIERELPVFEALRSLEVITWPVSAWTPERLAADEDEALDNIEASVAHLATLL
jgi:Ser/Thr protein kinase RdoA (MazF antagonist)